MSSIPPSDFASLNKGVGFVSRKPTTTISIYEEDVPLFTRIKATIMEKNVKVTNADITEEILLTWVKYNGAPN